VDRKRDAPIPWSVSLPCAVALGALLFGWHSLATSTRPQEPATPPDSHQPSAVEAKAADPAKIPASAPLLAAPPASRPAPQEPPPSLAPAPSSAPATTTDGSVVRDLWTPLSNFSAADLEEAAKRTAAPAVSRLRDRSGSKAKRCFVRIESSSRTLVVASEDDRVGRGETLVGTLAAFGRRFDALVLDPARVAESARPWVAVFLAEKDAGGDDPTLVSEFDGVIATTDMRQTCRDVGVREARAALVRGPNDVPLEWLVAGLVGVAASDSFTEAMRLEDEVVPPLCPEYASPIPTLSQLVAWRTPSRDREVWELERLARLATSFVAFCLQHGPKDPRARGLFELLELDGPPLPQEASARDAEIAARLGATRLEELESAWRAARR
jgi:hypothetical protein